MAAALQECVHAAVRSELGGRDKESAHRVPQTHRDPEEKSIQQIPAVIFFSGQMSSSSNFHSRTKKKNGF